MNILTKTNAKRAGMVLLFGSLLVAETAFAQSGGVGGNASKVLEAVKTVLTTLAVVIVTIAIIFAGYQVAFMHKRFTDVAPIVIGALLIGGAAQIASMLINGTS